MFERFTGKARRVVVLSQESARNLQHNYIGTEHLLLGLLSVPDSIAARALARIGLTQQDAEQAILRKIGRGKRMPSGHIPFTPRAKKILELALREALQFGHNYIGTEHLLLGILSEGHGVAAQILAAQAGDLVQVRMAVLDLLPLAAPRDTVPWPVRTGSGEPDAPEGPDAGRPAPDEVRATPAAQLGLGQAVRLAGEQPVGSHHLVLAALNDPASAAARALAGLGVDLEQARQALQAAEVAGSSDERPREAGGRQLLIRVEAGRLAVETSEPDLLQAAQAAAARLGERADGGIIRGDLPECESLGAVWAALRDSLDDIRAARPPASDGPAADSRP